MAWRRTCTSTSPRGSMRPELGRTQYLQILRQQTDGVECVVNMYAYCFGAVVLTLNATGSLLGLRRRRTWDTSCVKGPAVYQHKHGSWPLVHQHVRLKPNSGGSNSTDMVGGGLLSRRWNVFVVLQGGRGLWVQGYVGNVFGPGLWLVERGVHEGS